jgi:hypothetical protein
VADDPTGSWSENPLPVPLPILSDGWISPKCRNINWIENGSHELSAAAAPRSLNLGSPISRQADLIGSWEILGGRKNVEDE